MPQTACRPSARKIKYGSVIMAYNEGLHHPIGRDAFHKYAVPFLLNKLTSMRERLRGGFTFWRRQDP